MRESRVFWQVCLRSFDGQYVECERLLSRRGILQSLATRSRLNSRGLKTDAELEVGGRNLFLLVTMELIISHPISAGDCEIV
jgi:hypothetical protein